jgi:hypothetical protein
MLANGRWDLIRRLKGSYRYYHQPAHLHADSVAIRPVITESVQGKEKALSQNK